MKTNPSALYSLWRLKLLAVFLVITAVSAVSLYSEYPFQLIIGMILLCSIPLVAAIGLHHPVQAYKLAKCFFALVLSNLIWTLVTHAKGMFALGLLLTLTQLINLLRHAVSQGKLVSDNSH